jgi:hypothetical protein
LLRRSPLSKSAIEHSVTEATRRTFNALYLWVIEWIADPSARYFLDTQKAIGHNCAHKITGKIVQAGLSERT